MQRATNRFGSELIETHPSFLPMALPIKEEAAIQSGLTGGVCHNLRVLILSGSLLNSARILQQ